MTIQINYNNSKNVVLMCSKLMASSQPWNQLFFDEQQCLENLSSPDLAIYLAMDGSDFAGFIALRPKAMEGEPLIEYLCVEHSMRGKGIGTRLLEFVEQTICPDDDNIFLFVSDINPRAMKLYEKIGYEKVGELPDYNLFGQTEFLYRKTRRPKQERSRPVPFFNSTDVGVINSPRNSSPELNLTQQQNEGIATGARDLATGYACLPLLPQLAHSVVEGTKASLGNGHSFSAANEILQASVGNLLNLNIQCQSRIRTTFSGSIAIERTILALKTMAASAGKIGLNVIILEPSIDLPYLLMREQGDIRIIGARCDTPTSSGRVDSIIEMLEKESTGPSRRMTVVFLDSPSNPFGVTTDEQDLFRLGRACGKHSAVLIMDHCFLLAGIHFPATLPNVFSLPEDLCDWIGIWDTGKSIDVAGDKLGFIIPGSHKIEGFVDETLSVIQPSSYSARRKIEVFSRILSSPILTQYLSIAGSICRENLNNLQAMAPAEWHVPLPSSGTFACVHHRTFSGNSDSLRKVWMKKGVSVASGRAFYASTFEDGMPFVRISLLRDTKFFREAITKLC